MSKSSKAADAEGVSSASRGDSARTAMEAVYTLLGVERGVPEVWGSKYDIRALLNAANVMRDGEPIELPEQLHSTAPDYLHEYQRACHIK